MLRAAARAHGPTTHYCYSALVPTPTGLHPMPAMIYADDDMVVTGDHVDIDPHFTAQRNALFPGELATGICGRTKVHDAEKAEGR